MTCACCRTNPLDNPEMAICRPCWGQLPDVLRERLADARRHLRNSKSAAKIAGSRERLRRVVADAVRYLKSPTSA
jgi:hypothetical protein